MGGSKCHCHIQPRAKLFCMFLDKTTVQPLGVKRGNEACPCKRCCSGKATSIAHSECVFIALVIQHAMRMRHVILPSVACPTLRKVSTLSHKEHDFRANVTEHKMCVLIFSTNFVWKISHSKKNSAEFCHKCYAKPLNKLPTFHSNNRLRRP